MKKVSHFLSDNPRYNRYKKPLEAAKVCEATRELGKGRFGVISFSRGLLSLSVSSPAQMMELQAQSDGLINEINQKLRENIVERVRFKIV